jgi:hypothetical protein
MLSERYKNDGKVSVRLNEVQKTAKLKVEQKIASGVYRFEDAVYPVCNNAEYEHLAEKDRYGLYCNTVICKKCGLLITHPRMNQVSLNQFYSEDYRELYTGSKQAHARFFSHNVDRANGLSILLENMTGLFPFGTNLYWKLVAVPEASWIRSEMPARK